MLSALRAAVSVCMIAGFYFVALGLVVAAAVGTGWLLSVGAGAVAVKIALPLLIAIVGAVFGAFWQAIRAKPEPPEGVPVGPHQAPALWSTVQALAVAAGTRMPDEIRLIPEVNAAVTEDSKLLGLVPGRRYLYIGLPLLQAMRVDELWAVLAHELGHYSGNHTRLGAIAYRGRIAIGGTVGRIGSLNPAGWVLKAYAYLYVLVNNAVVRRQEYEADQTAVRVAGRETAARALQAIPALDAAWDFYFEEYVAPGWEFGYAPDDVFGGFGRLVAARHAELNQLRQAAPPSGRGSMWDTHPPLPDRITAILATPGRPAPADGRPAGTLIPHLAGAGHQMQRTMVNIGDRQVLPWSNFTAATTTARYQRQADLIFRTASRVSRANVAGLREVFWLLDTGRIGPVAAALFSEDPPQEAAAKFPQPLEMLLELAAIRSGAAFWQHSWSGPARLVDRGGAPLDLAEVAKIAMAPGGAARAHRRLGEMGIDMAKAVLVERTASAVGADVIGALANIKVNGTEYDLVVLDNGLVLVANPGEKTEGENRLGRLLASAPAPELAKANWFLPYEEVATASVAKKIPVRATLTTHDGRRLELQEGWTSEMVGKKSRDVFLEVLETLSERTASPQAGGQAGQPGHAGQPGQPGHAVPGPRTPGPQAPSPHAPPPHAPVPQAPVPQAPGRQAPGAQVAGPPVAAPPVTGPAGPWPS